MNTQIVSLGYEGRSLEELIAILQDQQVTKLLDIREAPFSRKKGFSKKALSLRLKEAGISYLHLPEAGNPFRRQKTNIEHCLQLYSSYLTEHPQVIDLVVSEMSEMVTALLCYEREHDNCHRSVLIETMRLNDISFEMIKIE